MKTKWQSMGLYQHPAKHQTGTYGNVVLSEAGVYCLKVGSSVMSCPQDWAAKIHKEEGDEKESAIITRKVPESLRARLKSAAALEGKTMQDLVIELITKHVDEKDKI